MASGTPKRTRSDRVASLVLPPSAAARALEYMRRGDILLRLGICFLTALIVWLITGGWAPPFVYRTGDIPSRDIIARVSFEKIDEVATREAKEKARREIICIYANDPVPLNKLQQELKDNVFQIIGAESYELLDEEGRAIWKKFQLNPDNNEPIPDEIELKKRFDKFHAALEKDTDLSQFESAISSSFADNQRNGLLKNLAHGIEQGSLTEVVVHPVGNEDFPTRVAVDDIRSSLAHIKLHTQIANNLTSSDVSDRIIAWLENTQLPETLSWNITASEKAADEAEKNVKNIMRRFEKGEKIPNALAGQPLSTAEMEHLKLEHQQILEELTTGMKLRYSLASYGMYLALFTLCGFYIYFRENRILSDIRQFSTLLGLIACTVAISWCASSDKWRAELIPILLFGMIVTIAYQRELALLLTAAVSLLIIIALGQGLASYVTLVATVSAAILLLGRIRSRTKLIYVGLFTGIVSVLTTLGVNTLDGQPFESELWLNSLWNGGCALVAGVLITGLLPFVESLFDVQTEISLLELGDAAHPLLQELVRRAPGTYNHSINVASIAEAAAERIGANGLLVRVGAYFHDIGKMLKPGYFIENQGQDSNCHESLLPAMSTLVIIAHVKDGADLARQHHLPNSIVDFIQQHHGTTLVEYFFDRANQQSKDDPDAEDVDENNYRYPGPKPQTKEAGVMMIADAVESASRALVDPTPSRIESLVRELALKRLLDGQFDECGLTLQELHEIEDSLIKSLTVVYHGRVQYPDQQTA